MPYPTPHLEKLTATLANDKLPVADHPRIQAAISTYQAWIADLDGVDGTAEQVIARMVDLLNSYRNYIDVDLVFDSTEDFLYRQKGQLKLDNSVIEEFLPRLVGHPKVLPELQPIGAVLGPTPSFSATYFNSSLDSLRPGGGLAIKTKNQDFALAKPLFLMASHSHDFADAVTQQTYISYVAAECKTNLDKTMFQEACATAHDTKTAVAGARYYLLCEWLDMSPQSTAPTDIDEIIILRKAKRLNSNVRAHYSSAAKRRQLRGEYLGFLQANPFRADMFGRFVGHIRELIRNEQPIETSVLQTGYF
ncbi:Bpu10I family restriction endonuclease [Tepidimonas sp.]|uniref:Bpu10I family restriction endonuclease n=1 Tax=Tepidimonas sp. TaxID=2002775 RepID=UPI002FE04C26